MLAAVEDFAPDCIIHLGDYVRDAEYLRGRCPAVPMLNVSGNCDYCPAVPDSLLTELGGVRIFMAHGHRHGVKLGLDAFLNSAHCAGAALALFGHTHVPLCASYGDLQVMNPGSCGYGRAPTYGRIVIENGAATCEIVKIED